MRRAVYKKFNQIIRNEQAGIFNQLCDMVNAYPIWKRIGVAIKIIKGRW